MYGMPEMASMLPAMAGHRGYTDSAHEHALPGVAATGYFFGFGSRKLHRIAQRPA